MKSAISSLVVLVSLVSGSSFAAITDGPGVFTPGEVTIDDVNQAKDAIGAPILFTEMDPASSLAGYNFGYVSINFTDNQIEVTLERKNRCVRDENRRCMPSVGMPIPYRIVLPLISQTVDQCGRTIYIAGEDMRPVDGMYQSLTVIDGRNNYCVRTMEARPNTTIILDRVLSRMAADTRSRSTMYAGDLEQLMFAL